MELILIVLVLVLLFGGGGGYWGRSRGYWWPNASPRSAVSQGRRSTTNSAHALPWIRRTTWTWSD